MVPAEIRLGFDPRARGRLQDGPELSGQGYTTQKLQQPRENLETIGGRTYQVYSFKTAIAAADLENLRSDRSRPRRLSFYRGDRVLREQRVRDRRSIYLI